MRLLICGAAALSLLSVVAMADEPQVLTDNQLDQVTAGGITQASVFTPNGGAGGGAGHEGRAFSDTFVVAQFPDPDTAGTRVVTPGVDTFVQHPGAEVVHGTGLEEK